MGCTRWDRSERVRDLTNLIELEFPFNSSLSAPTLGSLLSIFSSIVAFLPLCPFFAPFFALFLAPGKPG